MQTRFKNNFSFYLLFCALLIVFGCKKNLSNPPPPSPVACFNTSSNFQKINESINFSNCSENFETVKWDFGDGSTSAESNPTYRYARIGQYNVTLDVFKINQSARISKKILIANQVQMDFNVLMKNFKGAVTNGTFTCQFYAINGSDSPKDLIRLNYPSINSSNYTIKADLSGLYIVNNALITQRFKMIAFNAQGAIDSIVTQPINIIDCDAYLNYSAKLNFCDVDYAISLKYLN